MDSLETPYDEDAEFIECTVCEKSIRGDTLYKIHLTTPGHIKKEDALVAAGHIVRHHSMPIFEDIIQYLDYMKLDEPIIGLNYLDEIPSNDPQAGPRYTCRLCHQTAHLTEMVRHLIGRKHRQKYVEMKRPDLVTWDKQSIITQGGKIIRARAEIIERQDGRGRPLLMANKRIEGNLNFSRVSQRQKQSRGQNSLQSFTQRDALSNLPKLMDFKIESSHQARYSPGRPNTPPFHPDSPYMMNRDRQMYQLEDGLEEKLPRADYRESDVHRNEYMESDYHRKYEEEYAKDPQRAAMIEPGVPKYDSRAEMSCSQPQREEYYQEEGSSHKRPHPERDSLESYTEDIRSSRVFSAEYEPSQLLHPESNNHRWSMDRESGRHGSMNRTEKQGSSEPEAKRRSFPTMVEGDRSCDLSFNIHYYGQKMREPRQAEAIANPGRTGPPKFQRQLEVTRCMSDIPEPFKRFLKGAANDQEHGKRKRKSRFSDATAEEVETTKGLFSEEYNPLNPKFGGCPRPVSPPLRAKIHEIQHPPVYPESQGSYNTENYQRGGSESVDVFDMLKNVEIENAEEADFLKTKLCDLLKEFKAKKSVKAGLNNHGRAVSSKDYNSLKPEMELTPRHHYERILSEDLDLRQPVEDLYFQEDHRGRGWKQHEHIPEEVKDYHHSVCGEPRHPNSSRSRYEEVLGQTKISAMHPNEPTRYPERFQEPMHPRDYRPAGEEFLEIHSSAPALHTEHGARADRGARYSNNLDKITSTLLELVKRK